MSIKHFHELPIPVIRAAFRKSPNSTLNRVWSVTEKFDGSYIRAGIDFLGKFYTARKGLDRKYSIDEWDDKPWTNAFKSAHLTLESYVELLVQRKVMVPGDYLDVEIINGSRPNTIAYPFYLANTLFVFGYSCNGENSFDDEARIDRGGYTSDHDMLISFGSIMSSTPKWYSFNGENKKKQNDAVTWQIMLSHNHIISPLRFIDNNPVSFEVFFDRIENILDSNPTVEEILTTKLVSKPAWLNISTEGWKTHKKFLINEIKKHRERLRDELEIIYCIYARIIKQYWLSLHSWRHREVAESEGVVIEFEHNGETVCAKFVDKQSFSVANNFTHIVRYWLQGGRRPERPSFVSRTANWPVEKRLERLEVLRDRFIDKHEKLTHNFCNKTISYGEYQLKQRTLLLFAELREKIQNGWISF